MRTFYEKWPTKLFIYTKLILQFIISKASKSLLLGKYRYQIAQNSGNCSTSSCFVVQSWWKSQQVTACSHTFLLNSSISPSFALLLIEVHLQWLTKLNWLRVLNDGRGQWHRYNHFIFRLRIFILIIVYIVSSYQMHLHYISFSLIQHNNALVHF